MRLAPILIALLLVACNAPVAPAGSPGPSPAVTAPAPATPTAMATSAPSSVKCGSGDPLAHVYHPARLQVLAPCVTVRGVILSVHQEPDGDLHVRLRVDADQRDPRGGQFTNAVNGAQQGGALVLEPVCEGPVTQSDAVAACAAYHNPLVVPPVGSHVEVSGPWVLDVPHGWLEIHPLQQVEVLR
jgi:hypothetical protein